MNQRTYTFVFALIVCVICSVLLSAVSEGLKPQQKLNADLEVKKNILKAVQLKEPVPEKATSSDILKIYESKIQELVVDDKGNVVEGKNPKDLKDEDKNMFPLYVYKEGEKTLAYCYPIVGQGLWSTLYGYLAIEGDAITVRGITFYKHGETPGLGGEIESKWFQDNFKGKKIYSVKGKKLTPIQVVKGKAAEVVSGEALDSHVDGITAATLTGVEVNEMLNRTIQAYEAYFSKIRKI